jgi:hypothetical protein
MRISTTITIDRMSVKYPAWARLGRIDVSKKLSSQPMVRTRMINTSTGIFLYRFVKNPGVTRLCFPGDNILSGPTK